MAPCGTAVFIDKDGTLVEDLPGVADPARLALLPGAAEGLRRLHEAGRKLFVVSNQPGVARGRFRAEDLEAVSRRLEELAAAAGAWFTGFYYCPHDPDGRVADYAVACACRKPLPGLILRACRDHGLDARRAWMVGDILHDVEAGRRASCRTVLVDNGHETEWRRSPWRTPHYTAPDLARAAELILGAA